MLPIFERQVLIGVLACGAACATVRPAEVETVRFDPGRSSCAGKVVREPDGCQLDSSSSEAFAIATGEIVFSQGAMHTKLACGEQKPTCFGVITCRCSPLDESREAVSAGTQRNGVK